MELAMLIGSLGVALLLLAFFLNLFKFIAQDGYATIGMNVAGAALACRSSWIIAFMPFVILEAVWRPVALAALVKRTSHAQES
jgi:glucose-6-phosphate-specific signal transduction histidine kinase